MKKLIAVLTLAIFLTGCEEKWTEKDKNDFMKECVKGLVDQNWTQANSQSYCSCYLDKLVQTTKSAKEANKLSEARTGEIARGCMPQQE